MTLIPDSIRVSFKFLKKDVKTVHRKFHDYDYPS